MGWSPAGRRCRAFQLALFAACALSFSVAADSGSASGTDLQGKSIDPIRQAAGRPVVLIFVRTDCPISNRYAPTIQKMQSAYAGKADFWLVYPDRDESAEAIGKHLHAYGYKLGALRDTARQLVSRSQASVTPEAAVFNGHGELLYHGRIDDWFVTFGRARPEPTTHELQDALDAALAGRKPAVTSAEAIGCYISDLP